MARGVLRIQSYVDPAKSDEFNKWYNEEHLPAVCDNVEGFVSARRYEPVDGDGGTFVALYEIDADSIEEANDRLMAMMKSGAFTTPVGVAPAKPFEMQLLREIAAYP